MLTITNQTEMPTKESFDIVVKEANAGDAAALAELRSLLDDHPEIWRRVGDLGKHAELAMIGLIAEGNVLIRESLLRVAREMREELGGKSPSPMEKLAVQRIVACWLKTQWVDTVHPTPQGETLAQANFGLKLKESAQRRFAAAMRSLVLIRRLLPATEACDGRRVERNGSVPHTATKGWPTGSQYNGAENMPINRIRVFMPADSS